MRPFVRLPGHPVSDILSGGKMVYPRFPYTQNRHYAHPDQQGHDFVGHLPGPVLRQVECAGASHQQRQPVAKNVGGCQGRLQTLVSDFNAIGINGHILGGGGKGNQQPTKRHDFRR